VTPVIYNDVLAAVAFVSSVPAAGRPAAIARLLTEAQIASDYKRRHLAAHPIFGDGSVMTAALRHARHGDVSFASVEGLDAWLCVLAALRARYRQADAQYMQRVTVGSRSSRLAAISSPQSSQ